MDDPAIVSRFIVEVDGVDLGSFTSCQGLQATYGLDVVQEGGSLGPSAFMLKGITYSDITLQRAVDSSSAAIAAWFTAFAGSHKPTTGSITALDPGGAPVCVWNVQGVVPKQWSGPQLAVDQSAAAKETLVLSHTGFVLAG